MKIKNLFALLLAITLLTCICVVPTSAKNTQNSEADVEIIIHDSVSTATKEKIENYFANGEPTKDNTASTYGLTCTLFGHDLKNTMVSTITHKVSSTSPRCLKRTYAYEECTRCDYETSQLVKSEYIVCCS